MNRLVSMTVNGETRELAVVPNRTLLDALRNEGSLTGTKKGCDVGDCGACTVIMDGRPVNACLVLAIEAEGATIETIEGLQPAYDQPHLRNKIHGARRCAVRLLHAGHHHDGQGAARRKPGPERGRNRFALAGNICRCTGYTKIIDAVRATAEELRKAGTL